MHCNTMQYTATTLEQTQTLHIATHCNALQHDAIHCNNPRTDTGITLFCKDRATYRHKYTPLYTYKTHIHTLGNTQTNTHTHASTPVTWTEQHTDEGLCSRYLCAFFFFGRVFSPHTKQHPDQKYLHPLSIHLRWDWNAYPHSRVRTQRHTRLVSVSLVYAYAVSLQTC